jgi:predicted membrane-bound dolichyl-phosphate-mannose-protein mannosyltransferase
MLKIANVVLSLVAGYIAISIFSMSHRRKDMKAWKALIYALVFFVVQEILGALRAFGIYSSPFLTHIVPAVVLAFLIYALAVQIHVNITKK